MIILIVLTIAMFASWLLIPHKLTRYILGSITTLLFIGLIIGIVLNMTHHFGMEKTTVNEPEKQIYSAGSDKSPTNMLIANEIGNNSYNYVMVYKDKQSDDKPSAHFKPSTNKEDVSDSVKKVAYYETSNVNKATVKTKKEYWTWKNDYYRYLFDYGKEDKELIKQTSVVTVPSDTWVVLDAKEAKKLQKQQRSMSSKSQDKMKEALQKKMISYKKEHPKASEKEMKDYLNTEKQRLATQQIKEMLK
ncbi:DUF4811 domain-containing protein [Staphylococcus croceilyticus]|uniref:DUF4811 domain-containing protein n=1 Tax=Staphylococcus croceilyticus TaxID=319942 RepID=A0ABY2KF30_9STAP|nr:DUF4811 domain-containing protein [Staphylococcus croceilyticus]PNZ70091.1 DUF4811 domain-containing protein [Staphylococcus croceilyticus]TGA80508.1 DUF4811 domain-containing protein [Staphylococcus croceilyticus]